MAKKEEISIFGGAKTKAPSVAKKDDKEVVVVKGLEEKLLEFEFIKAQIKDLTAQEKTLNSEIKDIAKEKFVELYQSKRGNPNTFLIKDGEGCVMILPSDAYIKIGSEARANELMEAYGDDAVTVDEQFVFNNSVLQRNMKAIEKAIRDAKGVSDDDKRDLIDRIVEFKVAKGFIDRLYEYGDNMETVLNDIQPIISLKSCGGRMEDGGELDGDFMGNIYGDGGNLPTIEEIRDNGEFMDSYMIDESQSVSNAGEQESWLYNEKNYLITVWNERALEHKNGEEEMQVDESYDEYRKGGRVYETGRAYKRDRAYKSNQPHELAYHRKTRPKNPRYKKDTSFFANGGGVDNLLKDIDEGDVITIFKLKEYANGLIEGYRSIIKEEEYTILIDYDKEIAYYFTQDGADLTFVREEIFRKLDLDDKDDYADGGGVEKFNIGDKVKVVKGANKGVKGVISNTDSDFFGDYTIDVRGHKLYGFKADSLTKLPKYKMMADGGAVKTVFTKDGVEVEKGTDRYKGHIFYHSDGVGYMCLGYFPNLDDCMYRNMETGVEVVGCMDGFYYYDPMIFIPSYSHGGMHGGNISTATLEEMVGRKLNGWNDDVVYFNGAKYQKLYLQPFYVIA